MEQDREARERVLKHIMAKIHHLPLPARRRRYGVASVSFFCAYAACLALMAAFRGPVVGLWQWLIGTAWVSLVEWAVTSRWSSIDMTAVFGSVLAAAWMVRKRGHSRG